MPLSGGAPGTRASRRCDRAGRWEPGDYSHCLYTNDITRVLYTFVLVRPGEERGRGHPSALVLGAGKGTPLMAVALLLLLAVGVSSEGLSASFSPSRAFRSLQGHPKHLYSQTQPGWPEEGRQGQREAVPLSLGRWC